MVRNISVGKTSRLVSFAAKSLTELGLELFFNILLIERSEEFDVLTEG